jgi:hypothetical protein
VGKMLFCSQKSTNQGKLTMGGERETVIEQKSSKNDVVLGSIRVHENKGEVHFHDDDRQLKVAIPVAAWYSAWTSISSGKQSKFKYIDTTNMSQLSIKCKIIDGYVTLKVTINPIEFDNQFEALDKFTGAK